MTLTKPAIVTGALAFAFAIAAPACAADGPSATIGLSLAPLIGEHVEAGAEAHTPPIPIPIGQLTLREKQAGIFFESLPGSPTIAESSSDGVTLSTHLAFLDAVARVYDRSDRYWIGGGEIAYDQSTNYVPTGSFDRGTAVSASRVVGGRYEFGAGLARDPRRVRLWVDLMPALHGVDFQQYRFQHLTLPETGSQFETQLAIANAHGPFEFDYGARYVNYLAHFTSGGSLADRNTGFLPYATFAYRFGRR